MQPSDSRSTLAVGLIGGLLGALLVASMPAVMAAVGDPIRIGNTNTGNAVTVLRNDADPSLKIVNPSGDTALDLRVGQGNRPLKVDSNKRIPKLNADRLDGRNANQMLRVGYDSSYNVAEQNGPAVSTPIIAPTDGFLVMSGSIAVEGNSYDLIQCRLGVSDATTTGYYGHRKLAVHYAGAPHTSNAVQICATNATKPVDAGTYDVFLDIDDLDSAALYGADVWVVFVPFDGSGNPPGFF